MPTHRPTAQTVRDLVDAWALRKQKVLRGEAPAFAEGDWVSQPPMKATVDAVTALVMEPDLHRTVPLLTSLLEHLGPSNWPLVQEARVWLMHKALEAWTVASTLRSEQRCRLLGLFLASGSSPNGDLRVAGESPLHQALHLRDVGVVQALVDAGADPHETLQPPLDVHERGPSPLMMRPNNFPHKRQMGETLLHLAAIGDDAPMCERLIALGVSLGPALRLDGQPGRTPATAARENDSHEALAVIERAMLLQDEGPSPPGDAPARRHARPRL